MLCWKLTKCWLTYTARNVHRADLVYLKKNRMSVMGTFSLWAHPFWLVHVSILFCFYFKLCLHFGCLNIVAVPQPVPASRGRPRKVLGSVFRIPPELDISILLEFIGWVVDKCMGKLLMRGFCSCLELFWAVCFWVFTTFISSSRWEAVFSLLCNSSSQFCISRWCR